MTKIDVGMKATRTGAWFGWLMSAALLVGCAPIVDTQLPPRATGPSVGDAGASAGCQNNGDCMSGFFCHAPTGVCHEDRVDDDSCASCPLGMTCDAAGECIIGSACGSREFELAPDFDGGRIQLVLDRSKSMDQDLEFLSPVMTRWEAALNALVGPDGAVTRSADVVEWGLTLFPSPDQADHCMEMGPVDVPVGPLGRNAVVSLLRDALDPTDENFPSGPGNTPTFAGLSVAHGDPGLVPSAAPRLSHHIVLVTDGAWSCGPDCERQVALLESFLREGITTHIVGFGHPEGGGMSRREMCLRDLAHAGGAPLMVPAGDESAEPYHRASSADELRDTIDAIAGSTISCSIEISDLEITDVDLLVLFDSDGVPMMRDPTHVDGWDYDSTTGTITLYGSACDGPSSLTAVQACPEPELP